MAAGFVIAWVGFPLLFRVTEQFREFVYARDLRRVTLLQAARMVGGMGFALATAGHWMPSGFTGSASVSDFVFGLTAFAAASDAFRSNPRVLAAWHVAGLLGMLLSGTLGILASPALGVIEGSGTSQPMTVLPFSLVPIFLGPVMQVLHFIALAQLWRYEKRPSSLKPVEWITSILS